MRAERSSNANKPESRAKSERARTSAKTESRKTPEQQKAVSKMVDRAKNISKSVAHQKARAKDTFEVAMTPSDMTNGGRMPATKANAEKIGLKLG